MPSAGVGQPMRVGVCLMVGAVLGWVGCASEDGNRVTDIAGIPVLDGATEGPGTALGGGFEVAEGSVLLGTVFPGREAVGGQGDGFRALLLITGDLPRVLQAYERQAAAVGLPLLKANAGGRCVEGRRDILTCSERAQLGQTEAGRSVSLRLWRASSTPVSHLYLDYIERRAEPAGASLPDGGRPKGLVRADVALPTEWPPLPQVGEPYEASFGQRPLRVEAGASLVAPVGLSGACSPGGGSTAVFQLDGDPLEAIRAYVEQTGPGDRGPLRAQGDGDGGRTWSLSWTNGESYEAVAIQRPGEPAYLLLDHCGTD